MRRALILALALAPDWTVAQETPVLAIAPSATYGPHLVGEAGRPVYAFVTDARGSDGVAPIASCRGRCLEDWPLVTWDGGEVPVSDGVSRFLTETVEWEGQRVVVYASRVLFYYHRDLPGEEPQGQAVHEWGGWWYLLRPDGSPIETGVAPEVED